MIAPIVGQLPFSTSTELETGTSVMQKMERWPMTQAGACAMSFDAAKDFEKYARDCLKLAEQPNTPPELRQQLFQMAREWIQAMMAEENALTAPK
jgi:hypothetical protein